MKRAKLLYASIGPLLLCGCQSLTVMALKTFDPQPYMMPIAAEQLAVAHASEATVAPGAADLAAAPSEPVAVLTSAATAEPERTDIRGRGDGQMVTDRVIVTGHKEISHRVPDYSREQVAALACARRKDGMQGPSKEGRRAYDATITAYQTRLEYGAGRRSGKELDAAERKRQDAVAAITGNTMFFGLFGGPSKKSDLPKPAPRGLVLEDVDLYTFNENGRPVMAVSGSVRNPTEKPIEAPPVTLTAIDGWEFILASQTSLLPRESLSPGEVQPFEIRFHNPPDTTYEVDVHFAPPFEYRLRRDCDPTDLTAGNGVTAPLSAPTATMLSAPIHLASELNLLTNIYRNEAEAAWKLRACGNPGEDPADDPEKPRGAFDVAPTGGGERRGFGVSINLGKFNREGLCASWSRRLPWRESFALGEAADEAWGAMLASQEMKRRHARGLGAQAEVDEAEAAFSRDYAAFRALGAKTLARAGESVPDVDVSITSAHFGYDQISKAFDGADISAVGFYVDVAGSVHNTAETPRQIDALMLALVDRLEQPLLTFRLNDGISLEAGEARQFAHRVYFNDPVRRKEAKDAPPWQVRVGAVGNSGTPS